LTFRKYFTWRKHIKRIHTNVENIDDANTEEAGDANAFNNNDLPDEDAGHQQLGDQIPRNQIKKSGALYLLNLQEVCRLPKATVDSVVDNTRTIIEEVVSNLQGQVEKCLQDNDIDVHAVTGLENLLSTENPGINVFENLDTDKKRVTYYKENFGLKVSTGFIQIIF
jgi:hypothetical protein